MQMMDIDVEKRSANDSGTEVPDVHKVGVLTFRWYTDTDEWLWDVEVYFLPGVATPVRTCAANGLVVTAVHDDIKHSTGIFQNIQFSIRSKTGVLTCDAYVFGTNKY